MTTTTAPALNARVIALAHHAPRALLEGVLTRYGITFHQSVTLRAAVVAGASVDRDELVAEVTGALKTDASVVHGVIEELTAAELLEAHESRLHVTSTGRDLYERTSAESAGIAARLYAGIPEQDLATAARVLTLITTRANNELSEP
ncbi:MarR family transcriptional regulator [Streptomyces sp. NPDC007851]|uniref:MarR family transcriptional regulator n=1 Tax=Streptomyces sp. NPDC007851 TaxID=3155008 RepID=UPI0033F1C810